MYRKAKERGLAKFPKSRNDWGTSIVKVDRWCKIHNFGVRTLLNLWDRGERKIAQVDPRHWST
jgi:hypothetical protein